MFVFVMHGVIDGIIVGFRIHVAIVGGGGVILFGILLTKRQILSWKNMGSSTSIFLEKTKLMTFRFRFAVI